MEKEFNFFKLKGSCLSRVHPLAVFYAVLCVAVLCFMMASVLNHYMQNQYQLIYFQDTEVKVILPRGHNYDDSIYGKSINNQKGVSSNLTFGDVKNEQKNIPNTTINATHINGIFMEPINANYTRNIYFTMKTTHKYYEKRLFSLMLTWLQLVDKNKVRQF